MIGFRLYGNIAGWKLLDLGADEFDLITTMEEYMQKDENIYFLIIKEDQDGDEPYKSIRSRKQLDEYEQEFYERKNLENKTIMELKKEMFELRDGKSPKTR